MNLKLIATAIFILCLQACVVAPQYTPLTTESKQTIQKTFLHNLVVQDEIEFSFTLSNVTQATGGGLLFAMIDSSVNKGRAKTAVEIMRPLYDASENIDFRSILGDAVYSDLTGISNLNIQNMPPSPVMYSNSKLNDEIGKLGSGEVLLHLSTNYFLTSDFKSLQAAMVAQIFSNSKTSDKTKKTTRKSNSVSKPIYYSQFTYQSDLIGEGGDESVAMWAKEDAALLKEKLRESAVNLVNLFIIDTQDKQEPCL